MILKKITELSPGDVVNIKQEIMLREWKVVRKTKRCLVIEKGFDRYPFKSLTYVPFKNIESIRKVKK